MEPKMEQFKAHSQVLGEFRCIGRSFTLKCAIELNIPNILHAHGETPISLQDLARSIPIPFQNIDKLRRIMRILTYRGIFSQPEENMYALTPASRFLLSSGSSDMSSYVRFCLDQDANKSLYYLSESLRRFFH